MASVLLLVFVVGLALLPIVYLQRSRQRWQWSIRQAGVAAKAQIVSIVQVRDTRGLPTGWYELTFEFSTASSDLVRTCVWVRSSVLRSTSLGVGDALDIHHMAHVPTEAVPDALDCRPAWANLPP